MKLPTGKTHAQQGWTVGHQRVGHQRVGHQRVDIREWDIRESKTHCAVMFESMSWKEKSLSLLAYRKCSCSSKVGKRWFLASKKILFAERQPHWLKDGMQVGPVALCVTCILQKQNFCQLRETQTFHLMCLNMSMYRLLWCCPCAYNCACCTRLSMHSQVRPAAGDKPARCTMLQGNQALLLCIDKRLDSYDTRSCNSNNLQQNAMHILQLVSVVILVLAG